MSIRFVFVLALCMSFVGLFSSHVDAQTKSHTTFTRSVIPMPRSVPPLHYWNGVDDTEYGVVVLTPTPSGEQSPGPNGFGIVLIDSTGFNSHKDSYWQGDLRLNLFQPYLRRGYTVFIVTHPPSGFELGTNSNVPLQPAYISAEIREFVKRSIIALKGSNQAQSSIPDWDKASSYGIIGGSSSANLAINLLLPQPQYRKIVQVESHANPGEFREVDTGFGALAGGSIGVDVYNWSFLGDYSVISRTSSGHVHYDFSGQPDPTNLPNNFPAPSTIQLPSHPTSTVALDFPQEQTPLIDKIVDLDPWTKNFPQLHHAFEPGAILQPLLASHRNFPLEMVFQSLLSSNRAANIALLTTPIPWVYPVTYPTLTDSWDNFLVGHRAIDRLYDLLPPNPTSSYKIPPILWYYGEWDTIVPPYQAILFASVYNTLPAANKSVLDQRSRPEQVHAWNDFDRNMQEEWATFIDKHVRGITDDDWDGLPGAMSGADSDDSDPDQDGDGQLDGNEFIEGGVNGLANLADDSKTFRIIEINKFLETNTTPHRWRVEIDFTGHETQSPSTSYVLQSALTIFEDDGLGGAGRAYPHWKDFNNTTFTSLSAGTYRFTVTRGVTAPADERFYRVAFVEPAPSSEYRRVSTAPVGIDRATIRRDTTEPIMNLICSPFMNEEFWSGKVNAVSKVFSGGTGPTGLYVNLTVTMPTLNNPQDYYAIVRKDAGIVAARPTPNPEEQGISGHWWPLEATGGGVIALSQRDSKTDASQILPGSSVIVRQKISLGDLFQGLENTALQDHWYKASDGNYGTQASPFNDGDKIQIMPRATMGIDWSLIGQPNFPAPTVSSPTVTLRFCEVGSTSDFGTWVDDSVTNSPPVNLSDFKLRPDEAVYYVTAPGSVFETNENKFWTSGFVPTTDVFAYVNALATDSSMSPVVPNSNTGEVLYGVSYVGWPFPQDSRQFNELGQSSYFFESGMTTDVDTPGTIYNPFGLIPNVPPSSFESTVLLFSDVEDTTYDELRGDDPFRMRVTWGTFETKNWSYERARVPKVRLLDLGASTHNLDSAEIAQPEEGRWFRSARGTIVLRNRDDLNDFTIYEWRMRRPYRRP